MHYAVVLGTSNEKGILCARFESQTTGWIGWGINPSGEMRGAEAVIGLPAENKVSKYILYSQNANGVVEMDAANQTLMDTSITQDAEGRTTMTFTKYLDEDRYGIFPNNFRNSFIYAQGSSDDLGYHGSTRGNFRLDLGTTMAPTMSMAPSPSPTAGTTEIVENANATDVTANITAVVGNETEVDLTEVVEDANATDVSYTTPSPTPAGTFGAASNVTMSPTVAKNNTTGDSNETTTPGIAFTPTDSASSAGFYSLGLGSVLLGVIALVFGIAM
jgi:hypothetical protein